MDILHELENMAAAVSDEALDSQDVDPEMIQQWQQLFGYSEAEARDLIQQQRDDWTSHVPTELWEALKNEQEALGFDRKAYSHWLKKNKRAISKPATQPRAQDLEREYLVRLGGPICGPQQIAEIAGLARAPVVHSGESIEDGGGAQFCRIDGKTKVALQDWVAREAPGFRLLLISHSRARKDLSHISGAPFLGRDCILPQHRFRHQDDISRPAHNEYPVWYFFYGTLANTNTLARLFEHLERPANSLELHPAQIFGGRLESWGDGKYKALVDGDEDTIIRGSAFLVASREHEDALCYYERQAYEVVRCEIELDARCDHSQAVLGCTFRFVGRVD